MVFDRRKADYMSLNSCVLTMKKMRKVVATRMAGRMIVRMVARVVMEMTVKITEVVKKTPIFQLSFLKLEILGSRRIFLIRIAFEAELV